MYKKITIIFIVLGLTTNAFAKKNIDNNLLNEIAKYESSSFKIKISKELLYTIVDGYSKSNPLYITAKIFQDFKPALLKELDKLNAKYKSHDVSKSWAFVKIYPKSKDEAIKISKKLYEKGYLFKGGLAQIESKYTKEKDIENMYSINYNIERIIAYIKICNKEFENKEDILECVLTEAQLVKADMESRIGRPYYRSMSKRYKKMWDENL